MCLLIIAQSVVAGSRTASTAWPVLLLLGTATPGGNPAALFGGQGVIRPAATAGVPGGERSGCPRFVSAHLGVHGIYSFVLPELGPGAIRELRDPDATDDDDE